ncbi:hypothetical protein LY76DRAFT_594395 [Colletotrichum caudatum]|nr:hypothetical protein LY76DRAFT_594395 [Colletotrichum caudatum]
MEVNANAPRILSVSLSLSIAHSCTDDNDDDDDDDDGDSLRDVDTSIASVPPMPPTDRHTDKNAHAHQDDQRLGATRQDR